MMFLKKKGVNKPKAPRRKGVQKKKENLDPWKVFVEASPEEYLETMEVFTENGSWVNGKDRVPGPMNKTDLSHINMFKELKSGIAWPLAQDFLESYYYEGKNGNREISAPAAFNRFKESRLVRDQTNKTQELLARREAKPLKIRRSELVAVGIIQPKAQRRQVKMIQPLPLRGKKQYEEDVGELVGNDRCPSPNRRQRTMFDGSEIPSQCEREYQRAPWMLKFTNKVIRGLVVSEQNEWATKLEVTDSTGVVWYKVTKAFYKMSCANERKFIPSSVAYLTIDGEVIEETQKMFNASLKNWQKEFTRVTPESYDVAKSFIMENDLLQAVMDYNDRSLYADEIIASFAPIKTNHDMARKLSYVLVFLTPLISGPQSFHQDIRDRKIRGLDIVNLDRPSMLPEIFATVGIDAQPYETKIKRLRALIERVYYRLVEKRVRQQYNPEAGRRRTQPSGMRLKSNVNSEEELAPGLVQKLRALIGRNRSTLCALCQGEVGGSSYNSIIGTQNLTFCNSACFDKFEFK